MAGVWPVMQLAAVVVVVVVVFCCCGVVVLLYCTVHVLYSTTGIVQYVL